MTYEEILKIKHTIRGNVFFNEAIDLHFNLISKEFNEKKLFYKYIFSNGRFLISTIIASVFYSRKDAFLSDVSQECLKTGMVSPNTISSLLTLFKVSGRILVINSKDDRRKKKYVMTEKGEQDILTLLNTMTPSIRILFPESTPPTYLEKKHIRPYFQRYGLIHNSSIFLINLVENSNIFLSKDSGHMILISLYFSFVKSSEPQTLNSIAKSCGVSRTHLKSIVIDAENHGLLVFDQHHGKIKAHNTFIFLFEEYMSFYFAFVQYSLARISID